MQSAIEPKEGCSVIQMTEWNDATLKEYRKFMDGNKATRDPVERSLLDIRDSLARAWVNSKCQTCPIAELVATASAALTFYQQSRRG
jgi:hypothetical protein